MKLATRTPSATVRGALALVAAVALVVVPAGCGSGKITGQRVRVRVGVSPVGGVVVLAPVYINGKGPFPFIVDTGASKSVIDQTLARRLGFAISPSHHQLTGVNATQSAGRIAIRHWRIGKVSLPAEPLLTLALASDKRGAGLAGLIGSDNLSRFGGFLLNYRQAVLILRPH